MASKFVRGTDWEFVLFPPPPSIGDERELAAFRKKCEEIEREADRNVIDFDSIKKRSIEYLAKRRSEKPDDEGPGAA